MKKKSAGAVLEPKIGTCDATDCSDAWLFLHENETSPKCMLDKVLIVIPITNVQGAQQSSLVCWSCCVIVILLFWDNVSS